MPKASGIRALRAVTGSSLGSLAVMNDITSFVTNACDPRVVRSVHRGHRKIVLVTGSNGKRSLGTRVLGLFKLCMSGKCCGIDFPHRRHCTCCSTGSPSTLGGLYKANNLGPRAHDVLNSPKPASSPSTPRIARQTLRTVGGVCVDGQCCMCADSCGCRVAKCRALLPCATSVERCLPQSSGECSKVISHR